MVQCGATECKLPAKPLQTGARECAASGLGSLASSRSGAIREQRDPETGPVSARRDFQAQEATVSVDLPHGGLEGMRIGVEVSREFTCGLARDVADLGAVDEAHADCIRVEGVLRLSLEVDRVGDPEPARARGAVAKGQTAYGDDDCPAAEQELYGHPSDAGARARVLAAWDAIGPLRRVAD